MASRSIASTWESIASTNSLMLWVSSSSIASGQFCATIGRPGKGIWLGFLKGESSRTPKACSAANQPSSKASFQASLMTGSAKFSASVNPSLYHLFSLASKAAFRLANSWLAQYSSSQPSPVSARSCPAWSPVPKISSPLMTWPSRMQHPSFS